MSTYARKSLSLFTALLSVLAARPLCAQAATQRSHDASPAYGKVPLYFERNDGQADPAAKFVAHGPGYSILLQPAEATLLLHHPVSGKTDRLKPHAPEPLETVRLTMLGTDPAASMAAAQPTSSYVNYMNSSNHKDWHLGVPTSLQARTTGLYPGIDVVYYGNDQRTLEYDFTVAPGADAAAIRMAVTGAKPVTAVDGSLRLQTGSTAAAQDLRFGKPVLYQQVDGKRQPVEGAFTVADNGEVGFHVGTYDHTRVLVIDPIISYASYFGGSSDDGIYATALNAAGQLYAVGASKSLDLTGTTGEFQPTNVGTAYNNNYPAAFVTKFSTDGSAILWTTYLSGIGDSVANGIAVNAADQPYVVGYTDACGSGGTTNTTPGEFPFTATAVQTLCNAQVLGFNNYESNSGGADAFLVKLSSDGKSELYGTPLGGSQTDIANSVVLDAAGKVYITGVTLSTQYVFSSNPSRYSDVPSYPVNNHGVAAIGLSNFPTTASAFYTNTTESKNNAVTCSSATPCPGLPDGSQSGPQDEQAFLTVLSADLGTIVYSSLLGGPVLGGSGNGTSATNGIAVAVNSNGIAYIGGNTSSAHWPVSAGAFAPTCANAGAANSTCNLTGWLAAFDPTKSGAASLLFNTYVNGQSAGKSSTGTTNFPGSDVFGLTTDSTGNVIATGDTNAVDFPTTTGTLQPSCVKFSDGNGNTGVCELEAFLTKVSPAGAIVWSTYLGATQADIGQTAGRALVTDTSNNVYLLANAGSSYLPIKTSLVTPNSSDYYVAELNSTATTLLAGTYIGIGGGFTPDNNSLSVDANGTVYFGGSQGYNTYGGTYLPVTSNAAQKTLKGNSDGFVFKLITQQQPSATALTVSPTGTATPTQTVTLTATLTTTSKLTGTLLPTGTVTFLNGTATVGTAKLNASGVATYTGTLAGGTYSITASYPGDTAFAASVSTATPLTVSSAVATTTTETVAPAASTFGTAEVLTATVLAGTTPATGGTVTFTAGTLTLATATVNAQGIATATVTPAVGAYTVIANYAGTYNATSNPTGFAASLSVGAPLTITKAASTTALASSATTVGTAANFTLTATVPAAATGTVTFNNGTVALGTGTVTNGVATLTTSLATAGSYSLTAVYGGDTNFTGSTSSALSVTVAVPGFTVTANPSSLTIARGSTGTSTLTFTPVGGFTGTLTLSCGTLPAKITCTFNPATVTLAGSTVADTLTIGTGSLAALSIPARPGSRSNAVETSLAILLPGSLLALFGLSRRRNLTLRTPLLVLLAVVALGAMGALSGCGNNNAGANATPAGTYTITVSVTGGTAATQSVPLNVVVQ